MSDEELFSKECYVPRVHDLLAFTVALRPTHQRLYRVIGCFYGGIGEESAIELEPIGLTRPWIGGFDRTNFLIPSLLLG